MAPTSRSSVWVAEEFDRRAATYDESQAHVWQADVAARLLGPQPGQLILDVATGTGLAARAVSHLAGPTATVVGIDISEQMLRVGVRQSLGLACHYVRADAQQLPFSPASFDAVLCVAAIPYLPDLPLAVADWRRVSRPSAALVFTTPAQDGLTVNRLMREAAAQHGYALPDPHATLGSESRIGTAVSPHGFTVTGVEKRTFVEPLDADPRAAFDTVIDYGFAEPLRSLSRDLRESIFLTYATAHLAAHDAGEGGQAVLFTRCRAS
ncbi:MAG: hypothetical protein AVDCRST_MAG75-2194 [uncultured Propionibacteriaceae bacterium]|uniref:Methyltransferase type 11 domain-containing protein n=1 Tax=uncultured Propionibacteriaceae bacterium TaxID=257457 RepID=A0A6J4P5Y0_9ACTN|nr:MAG: hypothetical protein AVDCRST_MAG75-2194 [uncultured Propionibacteriaceae bacterium]